MDGLPTVSRFRGTDVMTGDVSASDVAVLREQMIAQSRAISDLTRNTERLLELTTSIARMQERMEQHSDGLDRALSMIEKLDARSEAGDKLLKLEVDQVALDLKEAATQGKNERNSLKSEVDRWVFFGKGAWASASILWLLIAFLLVRELANVENGISTALNSSVVMEKRIAALEHKSGTPSNETDKTK